MKTVNWKLHLKSNRKSVFECLTTDSGRAKFWAEKTIYENECIKFYFPNGLTCQSKIIFCEPPSTFILTYFDSIVKFNLIDDAGGTVVDLINTNICDSDLLEVSAGWVSVLLALKAFIDHGIDLRNHEASKTWTNGFVDN